ncbi:hypothetical protein KLMA_60215 [Kluyveromyces marxianus DMKU3-1042]|uniref:Uncharacterized protein n=1 Tax=Kluyveromyces marxianus (strain DMKU3-1042 / BCC 29191 / NBRC 104275) TaxID=1003335 RepID=W0TFB1_KLUMD|nr:hypothetical protein KLMA_60215 [Kluyveromyces marxianus DMKU3-1042]BAO41506.1 hypothetical protein KLMA_60215 [Kluyveromyces marxianus DMKU3-1042]
MIIRWESGIEKETSNSMKPPIENGASIVNPRVKNNSSSDNKSKSKNKYNNNDNKSSSSNSDELPLADHRSNGFVNNPGLLHENEFYPMDPTNCWTHDPESASQLAYCSIVLHEENDPLLYKVVKHGMRHIQTLYHYDTWQKSTDFGSDDASAVVLSELNNDEFFDMGDLTIIACGEVKEATETGSMAKRDIENVEAYVCKLNLQYNEEHFIRLLQVEDILFSGLQWDFFTSEMRIGSYTSLQVVERLKRTNVAPWSQREFQLPWLDKEIMAEERVVAMRPVPKAKQLPLQLLLKTSLAKSKQITKSRPITKPITKPSPMTKPNPMPKPMKMPMPNPMAKATPMAITIPIEKPMETRMELPWMQPALAPPLPPPLQVPMQVPMPLPLPLPLPRLTEHHESVDETLRFLDSMIELESQLNNSLNPILMGKGSNDIYISDSELSKIFDLHVSNKSSLSMGDSRSSTRGSQSLGTPQLHQDNFYLYNNTNS